VRRGRGRGRDHHLASLAGRSLLVRLGGAGRPTTATEIPPLRAGPGARNPSFLSPLGRRCCRHRGGARQPRRRPQLRIGVPSSGRHLRRRDERRRPDLRFRRHARARRGPPSTTKAPPPSGLRVFPNDPAPGLRRGRGRAHAPPSRRSRTPRRPSHRRHWHARVGTMQTGHWLTLSGSRTTQARGGTRHAAAERRTL
jgi:hypothetical protein